MEPSVTTESVDPPSKRTPIFKIQAVVQFSLCNYFCVATLRSSRAVSIASSRALIVFRLSSSASWNEVSRSREDAKSHPTPITNNSAAPPTMSLPYLTRKANARTKGLAWNMTPMPTATIAPSTAHNPTNFPKQPRFHSMDRRRHSASFAGFQPSSVFWKRTGFSPTHGDVPFCWQYSGAKAGHPPEGWVSARTKRGGFTCNRFGSLKRQTFLPSNLNNTPNS